MSRFPEVGAETLLVHRSGEDPFALRNSDSRYETFRNILLLENERHNLTGIRTPDEIDRRLIDDSLRLVPILDDLKDELAADVEIGLIDIGSGAGIPALPLAIALPDVQITAVEATGKKADFIERAAHSLDLANLDVVHSRSEDLAHDHHFRGKYTFGTARAVGSLSTLVELVLPFLMVGGIAIFPKGADIEDEFAVAQKVATRIGGRLRRPIILPPIDGLPATTIVIADKLEATPGNFPRRAGIPAKKPLTG